MTAVQTSRDPLALFWWKAQPNFGDALSPLVVAHMSGRAVQHRGPAQARMVALGSLLNVVRKNHAQPGQVRPVVWGTGMLNTVRADFVPNVDFALLRGPISAAILGLQMDRFGDPGLLAPALIEAPDRQDRIGVIPHHRQFETGEAQQMAAQDPALHLINVAGDALQVCRDIAACSHVYSASLHGLIVADSFGVPNTWVHTAEQGRLKYLDYALSVGRSDMAAPIQISEIGAHMRQSPSAGLPYAEGIARAQEALKSSFPQSLMAGAAPSNISGEEMKYA